MAFYLFVSYIMWMLLVNAATALMYVLDKHAAQSEKGASNRIPERRLLVFSMLGGWPAALGVGKRIRHKTKKLSYRVWFAIAIVTNIGLHLLGGYFYWLLLGTNS